MNPVAGEYELTSLFENPICSFYVSPHVPCVWHLAVCSLTRISTQNFGGAAEHKQTAGKISMIAPKPYTFIRKLARVGPKPISFIGVVAGNTSGTCFRLV